MLQQWLWSSPMSDPGRRLLLGGLQGTKLCHGRAAGVPRLRWTLALVVFPSSGQDESPVKSCLSSPILRFREHQMCFGARTGFTSCLWGLQANKSNPLLWRAWPHQAMALPPPWKCGSPCRARSGCKALTGKPKSLQDHNSPSLGWKMSSRNVRSELSGRPNVASEIPARPQTGRIRGASSPGNISQGHKSQ